MTDAQADQNPTLNEIIERLVIALQPFRSHLFRFCNRRAPGNKGGYAFARQACETALTSRPEEVWP